MGRNKLFSLSPNAARDVAKRPWCSGRHDGKNKKASDKLDRAIRLAVRYQFEVICDTTVASIEKVRMGKNALLPIAKALSDEETKGVKEVVRAFTSKSITGELVKQSPDKPAFKEANLGRWVYVFEDNKLRAYAGSLVH